jgi:echinoid protein
VYDLTLTAATYDRDNGRFECRMKEGGSGQELHSMAIDLTVLLKPNPPVIKTPPSATEGRLLNLTCSSDGGSPPPKIEWFSVKEERIVDSEYIPGANRDQPTKAVSAPFFPSMEPSWIALRPLQVLSLMPTKEDDGNVYKCNVWNRAMEQGEQFEQTTEIFVNCESLRNVVSSAMLATLIPHRLPSRHCGP